MNGTWPKYKISHFLDTVLYSAQIGAPFLKGSNDSSKLFVVYWIIDFGDHEFAGVVSH